MWKGITAVILLLLLAGFPAAAGAETSGSYEYREAGSGTAVITGYSGKEKKLNIPQEVNGLTVTGIGDGAFYNHKTILSAVIPAGVRVIGRNAFSMCERLAEVTLPEGLEEIGEAAFSDCEKLAAVTLPDSLAVLGDFAFRGCKGMRTISVPGGVREIPFCAFCSCERLISVTIREGTEAIGEEAFSYCIRLENVTIPDSVREISQNAFFRCDCLESVRIPEHGQLKGNPFSACGRLREIVLSPGNREYVFADGVLFDRSGKKLVCYPAAQKRTVYEVPQGTEEIGAYAFGGCGRLRKVVIPDSVTTVGEGAFKWTAVPQAAEGREEVRPAEAGSFSERRYQAGNGTVVNYFLYIPETDAAEKLPVLIYFHGIQDIMARHHGIGELIRTGQTEPKGIVILPQAVNETTDADFHTKEYQDAVIELAEDLAARYNGDLNRLSVSGHSDGGVAAYQIVNAHPGVFAACAPVSAVGNMGKGIEQTCLWVFQGGKDHSVRPNVGLRVALKCESAGCSARHYVYSEEGHHIETMVFQDVFRDEDGREVRLIDWLMSKELKE